MTYQGTLLAAKFAWLTGCGQQGLVDQPCSCSFLEIETL